MRLTIGSPTHAGLAQQGGLPAGTHTAAAGLAATAAPEQGTAAELLWRAEKATAPRPLIGNRRIEALPLLVWESELLGFPALVRALDLTDIQQCRAAII